MVSTRRQQAMVEAESIKSFEEKVPPKSLNLLIDQYFGENEANKHISFQDEFMIDNADPNKSEISTQLNKVDWNVGIDQIRLQQERIISHKGTVFNMLVAGRKNVGKTTLINSLFDEPITSASKPGTTCLEMKRFKIVDSTTHLNLTVIETTGFGDNVNNSYGWLPVVNFIDESMRSYVYQEEQPYRNNVVDRRVHICLYLIEPDSLNVLDVLTMKELSKRVNLLPIISKCDILNLESLKDFKTRLKKICEVQDIEICSFMKTYDEYESIKKLYPLSTITSDEMIPGSSKLGRNYKWGYVAIDNPEYSDFLELRRLLINDNLVDFIKSTEQYYETCRAELLKTRILKSKKSFQDNEVTLDFENVDANGLQNYKAYAIFNKSKMDNIMVEWCPKFIESQVKIKRKFNKVIDIEENKFMEWKKALIEKQTRFNNAIELMYKDIDLLKLECQELEYQVVTGRNTNPENSTTLVGLHFKR
ncbi:hypothetical protein KAFR_0F04020 [Kazachstania africana CBS 2517]|uniref:Septin-type G domain-containing protein n=1 Tax=Kazachstania africana (strain ATCC 22294 / BCRC 22015 / CBS 2517 / CECT 1963 / NBRC 1671 / NRRL Y-8276) TaxID=1071382 RepID=H2AX97_KAZAF|nr:hypothetical protein KAFR_0F04020 [Kazachstania africana CBS 2517]CCF58997.1 hypothetical protein KAFR_0F04020 [Kazachstania africana CBS 2517]